MTGQVIPDVSKDCSVFIFRVRQPMKNSCMTVLLGTINPADGGTTILRKVGILTQLHSITPQKTWIHIRCCWSCMGVVATLGSGVCCQCFGGVCCFYLQGQSIQDMCQILTSIVVPYVWKKGELVLGPIEDCCPWWTENNFVVCWCKMVEG